MIKSRKRLLTSNSPKATPQIKDKSSQSTRLTDHNHKAQVTLKTPITKDNIKQESIIRNIRKYCIVVFTFKKRGKKDCYDA